LRLASEPVVEGEEELCLSDLGGEQHTTVGQLEPGFGTETGESWGRSGRKGDLNDFQLLDRAVYLFQTTTPCRTGEHLGQCERAAAERLLGDLEQLLISGVVVGICGIEVCDQHTRVEDDHAGQSSRSCSR